MKYLHHFFDILRNFFIDTYFTLKYERNKKNYPIVTEYLLQTSSKKNSIIDDGHIRSHPLLATTPENLKMFFVKNKKLFQNSNSLLNIGIGPNTPPDWLTFFRDVFHYTHIASLEVWDPYIKKWKYHAEFPVWYGDVRNILKILPEKSVDTILWAQGPEHLPSKDFMKTYDAIKKVARHSIIFVTPWGDAYDYQEDIHSNPYERHVIKSPDEKIYTETKMQIVTWGKKHDPNGGMLAYEFL